MHNPKHFLKKLTKTQSQLGKRKGPNVIWLKEHEDDSKLAYPDPKFKDGIPTLSRSLNDFEEGIAVLAGKANSGKSTLIVNMILDSLELNPDLMVLDFSFDDPMRKRYQQYIASRTGMLYQEITTDSNLSPIKLKAKENADALISSYYENDRLRTYEAVEFFENEDGTPGMPVAIRKFDNIFRIFEAARKQYPDRKIVAFIDALNNLDASGKGDSDLNQLNFRLDQLQEKSQTYGIMCFVSAHMRKSTERRAGIDDVKGTTNLGYNAVWVGIVRNEYRENLYKEPLMYEDLNGKCYPIITIEIHKTKVSGWDYDLFYGLKSTSCGILSLERHEYQTMATVYNGKRS